MTESRGRGGRPGRRVALVFQGFDGGGTERSMLRLGAGLMARGFAVDIVVGRAEGELLGEVPPSVQIVQLNKAHLWRAVAHGLASEAGAWKLLSRLNLKPLKRLFRRLPALVDYFRAARPDAVFAADPTYNSMAVWARRLSGLRSRVVVSEHIQVSHYASVGSPWGRRNQYPLLRRAYLRANAIVAVSDGVADDLSTYADIPRQRITTVHNPVVGPDLLVKANESLDHPWFAPGEPSVILAAGRLHPQKDFPTLIRAFARLRAKQPARLVILGAAKPTMQAYAEELKALAATLGVAEDVAMPGFVVNPLAFMARSSVFVLSSLYEGLGIVLIEALACGTPVVSTDCPSGPREILDHGRFGPLVPIGDHAELAMAIEAVLDDPPPAERLRTRAELFSVDRAVDHYLKLLLPGDLSMRPPDMDSEPIARRPAEPQAGSRVPTLKRPSRPPRESTPSGGPSLMSL